MWRDAALLGILPPEILATAPTSALTLPAGATLFEAGDPVRSAFVVRAGELVREGELLGPGAVFGEVELLLGVPADAPVVARTACELVGLPRESLHAALADRPELSAALDARAHALVHETILATLLRRFAQFPPALLAEVRAAMTWVTLARGQALCRIGEPADAAWLLLRGQLQVTRPGRVPPQVWLGPGELVGEVGLLTGSPRNADVVATRTSHLGRLSREAFDRLIAANPDFLRIVATSVVTSMRADSPEPRVGKTCALLRLDDTPATRAACDALAEATSRLGRFARRDGFEAGRQTRAGGERLRTSNAVRIEAWLDALEDQTDALWLDLSEADPVWRRLVLARADRVLLVAEAGGSPGLRPSERELYEDDPSLHRPVSLVLVHPAGTRLPAGTDRWLRPRRIATHHHVRSDHPGDHHRAARLLAGRGVGLVLGGGGALGAAHVGLVAALLERGVPVDYLGGTSAGGGIAAALAMSRDFEAFHASIVEHFVRRNPMRRPTLPFISLLSRAAVDDTARSMFGDALLEDLWVSCFCVSTNLGTGQPHVHREGQVWRAVRATSSIPVVLAPMVDHGQVLLDGGILDNLPARTMAGLCGGPVLGSDVVDLSTPGPAALRYEDLPRGRDLLHVWRDRRRPRPPLPTVSHVLQHLMLLGAKPRAAAQAEACDWYFRPDLSGFGVTDYGRFSEIATLGYRQARAELHHQDIASLVPGWSPDTPPSHTPPEHGISRRLGILRP